MGKRSAGKLEIFISIFISIENMLLVILKI